MDMTNKFLIRGGKPLMGTIDVRGSKNAATPIIAATLLTSEKCRISNLPLVLDVYRMIEMMESMGSSITWTGKRTIEIENKSINPRNIDKHTAKWLRSSVLFIGPLLARFGKVTMAYPGGCSIGARPIATHFRAFEDLGAEVTLNKKSFSVELPRAKKIPSDLTLNEFSVTATENVLMFLASRSSVTEVKIAASEPHVQDLAVFLSKLGAGIQGAGTPFVKIKGASQLRGAKHKVVSDYIEAGTFIFSALATGGNVKIKNAPVSHLDLVLRKLISFGANFKKGGNVIEVMPSKKMTIDRIQAMPYPGIPTDLQPSFAVLATQTRGDTLLHDPLYEGRFSHLRELNKMGARVDIHDPHRATIPGPVKLKGGVVLHARDLRGGAALLIAALAASGTTTLDGIEHIERGYEDLAGRFRALGARIERV